MARYVDGLKVATSIFEAAAYHKNLKVTCRKCGHHVVFNPHQLWWLFEQRYWVGEFDQAAKRFSCIDCQRRLRRKIRIARIDITELEPTEEMPFPEDRIWQKALSRHRG